MTTLLIRIGILDGWHPLKMLENMETLIQSPDFVQEHDQELVNSFLNLALVIQEKIILAYECQILVNYPSVKI